MWQDALHVVHMGRYIAFEQQLFRTKTTAVGLPQDMGNMSGLCKVD
jgi:hypothetical protein